MNLILFDSERNQKLIIIELNYYGIFNYEVIQNNKGFLGIRVVGKNPAKLERAQRSWKEPTEVGKFLLKLESFAEVGKFRCNWKV